MNDKLLVDIYKKFLEIRNDIEPPGRHADYDWYSLPKKLPGELFPYSEMLKEHSQEISNSINDLYRYIINLKTWDRIIHDLDDDSKYDLIIEMIDPFATLSINLIYAIRSRFFFSIAHLCHQANRVKMKKDWKDDLPADDDIIDETARRLGKSWKAYKKLNKSLEDVGKNFNKETQNFRHKYNHRYPPHIEFGYSEFAKRTLHKNKVSYGGYISPLKLSELTPALSERYSLFLKCHENYKKLIQEQIEAIEMVLE